MIDNQNPTRTGNLHDVIKYKLTTSLCEMKVVLYNTC